MLISRFVFVGSWWLLSVGVDAFTARGVCFRATANHNVATTTTTTMRATLPNRRKFGAGLLGYGILPWASSHSGDARANAAAAIHTRTTHTKPPLVDVPMVRLRLPGGGFGREYIALKLRVGDRGPFDFMVDSGLTTELITPHLQGILGMHEERGRLSGLAAGGSTVSNPVVELTGASIDVGDGGTALDLPKLTAVVTGFPQEHIDPAHDPVEGMLGMELLSLFDADLDFPRNRIRLFEPGTADASGLVEIPAAVVNESMLIGIRVSSSTPSTSTSTSTTQQQQQQQQQPVLALLDCGSTFSCINWKAAQALGLPPRDDPLYRSGPAVSALGIDGGVLTLPTIQKQLTYVGNPILGESGGPPVGFESPPADWKPWNTVQLAVGDIPAFGNILGDGVHPYRGPAALIGLDILAQRRVVLEAGPANSRRRKVAIAPE
mmetsp:Transcript_4399/g.9518  ORF Transcript_4399/g.9518 Transcript_4399/m.9518 type:complete len:435 (-) Transcript_4399:203-1507(-)